MHILAEDGLQLVMYTIASASQSSHFAVGIGVGVLQVGILPCNLPRNLPRISYASPTHLPRMSRASDDVWLMTCALQGIIFFVAKSQELFKLEGYEALDA